MQEQLDRIEASLAALTEQVGKLVARKRPAQAAKRQTKAQAHDAAVDGASYGHRTLPWLDAWMHWCARRKEARYYMTPLAITGALNKLDKFSEAAQIVALQDAAVKPWADVYPKEDTSATVGEDWFKENE